MIEAVLNNWRLPDAEKLWKLLQISHGRTFKDVGLREPLSHQHIRLLNAAQMILNANEFPFMGNGFKPWAQEVIDATLPPPDDIELPLTKKALTQAIEGIIRYTMSKNKDTPFVYSWVA